MENFIFKNINSNNLGIIVKEMPLMPRSEKSIEIINIAGRNKPLHIDNNYYLSRSYTISCVLKEKTYLDTISALFVGAGKLQLSKYPGRYFNAIIKNQIQFKSYLNHLNEFPLQFEIEPISYDNTETIEEIVSSGTINVSGNIEINPIIVVDGIGSFSINGETIQVLESGITIDCNLMVCSNNYVAKNDKVILNNFPKLNPGSNTITIGSGITKLTIKYECGWL